jgi:transposase-like protein
MNKLDNKTRVQILNMLVEGSSMRSMSRITRVSINTVAKLLEDAGRACAAYGYSPSGSLRFWKDRSAPDRRTSA